MNFAVVGFSLLAAALSSADCPARLQPLTSAAGEEEGEPDGELQQLLALEETRQEDVGVRIVHKPVSHKRLRQLEIDQLPPPPATRCLRFSCPPYCDCGAAAPGCPVEPCNFTTHRCASFHITCDTLPDQAHDDDPCYCYKRLSGHLCVNRAYHACVRPVLEVLWRDLHDDMPLSKHSTFHDVSCRQCDDHLCNSAGRPPRMLLLLATSIASVSLVHCR